jgi:hypothetical protein
MTPVKFIMRATKNNTIKIKNRIRARPAKAADMPVKPNRAANNDTTKKIIASVSIFSSSSLYMQE